MIDVWLPTLSTCLLLRLFRSFTITVSTRAFIGTLDIFAKIGGFVGKKLFLQIDDYLTRLQGEINLQVK